VRSHLSYLDHVEVHAGLRAIEIAVYAGEALVERIVKFNHRVRGSRKDRLWIAKSSVGRMVIAGALEAFYADVSSSTQQRPWKLVGAPTIGTVFPNEKNRYVGDHHSYNYKNPSAGCKQH
jgi:hypothetical protein